ncbi:histidine kinase [Bacillus sp. FJAT-22090]|uniref:sensor histidine kinase n=1 Tax=Bacillus sp. FJAT-22090 TaxID=1581038 RepID=UPI0006AE2616|nr:sensor histidine kinase [Bacillus sp. FJAT-22090]ALC87807.1 histidine kinase [Bacillus sp. FJAT-22090]
MKFSNYLRDTRFFLAFYVLLISFISLVIFLSTTDLSIVNNIFYINISSLFFVILYLAIGFINQRKFYQEMERLAESELEGVLVGLPKAQNYEQKLYLDLIKKNNINYLHELEKLQNEKREQQEFVMSWIHEVKLPIAVSRLLIEKSEDQPTEWLVDKFEDELRKIDDYVEQALYYSRIDSFSKDYFITEVNVNKIIKNSVKKYAKLFINKDIQINIENKNQYIQSDSKWLGFVIDQLLTNSLKYTDGGGKIAIFFEEDSKEKRMLILDNGMGIKMEDINRVFDRGFTGTAGRSNAKSTGMGLYLAKQLATKLGHDLTISSVENQFTKVVIHFPKIRNYYHL